MGGSADYGGMDCSIYGLTMSLTNQLSTLGQLIPQVRRNFVTVSAGDSVNGLSTVYQGVIYIGVADYASMPNNAFRIQVQSSLPQANRQWDVISLVHELESMVPGGAWRTKLKTVHPGQLQVGSK